MSHSQNEWNYVNYSVVESNVLCSHLHSVERTHSGRDNLHPQLQALGGGNQQDYNPRVYMWGRRAQCTT